jgi:hypothetical protein
LVFFIHSWFCREDGIKECRREGNKLADPLTKKLTFAKLQGDERENNWGIRKRGYFIV